MQLQIPQAVNAVNVFRAAYSVNCLPSMLLQVMLIVNATAGVTSCLANMVLCRKEG